MADKLKLQIIPSPTSNDHQVRLNLDDRDLLSKSGRIGLDPRDFFGQQALHLGGRALIGRCGCGTIGCDDLSVSIEIQSETVTWTLSETATHQFSRARYFRELEAAALDNSWESVERTAERLVEDLDFSSRSENGYELDWASARIKRCQIVMSFTKDGSQVLVDIGWDGKDPDDACKRVRAWLAEDAYR